MYWKVQLGKIDWRLEPFLTFVSTMDFVGTLKTKMDWMRIYEKIPPIDYIIFQSTKKSASDGYIWGKIHTWTKSKTKADLNVVLHLPIPLNPIPVMDHEDDPFHPILGAQTSVPIAFWSYQHWRNMKNMWEIVSCIVKVTDLPHPKYLIQMTWNLTNC